VTQNIKPTRSELMQLKIKIKLAKEGYNLLKKKRDGLILDFLRILKDIKNMRSIIQEHYLSATDKINMARVIESDLKIKSIALSIANQPEIQIEKKNVMGVVVPNISKVDLQHTTLSRGYGLYGSAAIDEAAEGYEKLTEIIVHAAEIEASMRKILKELEKTKRRVNALEYSVIPGLEQTKSFIQFRLEEAERENIFRMKRMRKKSF